VAGATTVIEFAIAIEGPMRNVEVGVDILAPRRPFIGEHAAQECDLVVDIASVRRSFPQVKDGPKAAQHTPLPPGARNAIAHELPFQWW